VRFLETTTNEIEITIRMPANMMIFHGVLPSSTGSPVLGSFGTTGGTTGGITGGTTVPVVIIVPVVTTVTRGAPDDPPPDGVGVIYVLIISQVLLSPATSVTPLFQLQAPEKVLV
jgi:hypothetical protein